MGKATVAVNADGRMAGTTAGWHRRIVALAVPIVLANLSVPLLSAVDTAVAGHLPDQADLGGVALGGLIFSAMIWGLGFLRMATTGLVAQALGAGDPAQMRLVQLRALVLSVLLGLILVVLQGPLLGGALSLLGGSAEVSAAARAYGDARIWSAPAALANSVVLGYLLGTQRAKLGFGLQLVLNFINMVLAIGLVYGLGRGVAGIGAATALADGFGLLLGLALLWRLRPRGLPPLAAGTLWARAPLLQLFAINRDIFLRTACLLGVTGLFARLGANLGDTVLAGNAVLLNFQTFTSFGLDASPMRAEALVGVAVGAPRPRLAAYRQSDLDDLGRRRRVPVLAGLSRGRSDADRRPDQPASRARPGAGLSALGDRIAAGLGLGFSIRRHLHRGDPGAGNSATA